MTTFAAGQPPLNPTRLSFAFEELRYRAKVFEDASFVCLLTGLFAGLAPTQQCEPCPKKGRDGDGNRIMDHADAVSLR